jgi:DNA polymerase (family 10)
MGESFKSKMPLAEARKLADRLAVELLEKGGLEWALVCGSIRREKPEVGDIDVVVIGNLDRLKAPGLPWRYVDGGAKKCTLEYHGRQVNILSTNLVSREAAVLYFTGNATFNLIMRRKAKAHGWKLNEYGLWDGERAVARSEADIMAALGLAWHEPRDRSK